MKISRNAVASVSFMVTDETDKVVGRTETPVLALIGYGQLVPGLEKALDGHEKGDEFTCKINPADAYGELDESLIHTIDRSMFGDFDLQVGNMFEADSSNGPVAVVVKEINGDKVVVDGNHPLAGKTLNFFVTVEDVRSASPTEIEHGHAHPDGICPSESCGCGSGGGCCGGGHGHGGGCGCHHGDEEELHHHHEGGCCGGGHGHGGCGCH